MKKLSMLLLALTLVLTACGGNDKGATDEPKTTDKPSAEEVAKDEKSSLELNKDIDMGSYVINIKEIKKAKANENKNALKLVFDFTNKSGNSTNVESIVGMKAFQNGVETDFLSYSDDIDIDTERKDVQNGAKLENVEKGVIIKDFEKEAELKIVDLNGDKEVVYKLNPKDYK